MRILKPYLIFKLGVNYAMRDVNNGWWIRSLY